MTDQRKEDSSLDWSNLGPSPLPPRPMVRLGIGHAQIIPHGSVASMLVGSCIGLFIYDSSKRFAAAAHVALPETLCEGADGKYADAAPGHLVRLLQDAGSGGVDDLVVKIAGAACMFGSPTPDTVGEMNINAIRRSLDKIGLRPAASHVGGGSARKLSFDSRDGSLRVTLLAGETVEL